MSADLLLAALVVDEERQLDFDAADRAIAALQGLDVTEPDFFVGHDPDRPEGLEQIRAALRSDLRELRDAIEGRRYLEIAEMNVRGARLYITGGLSYGDGPTEIWDAIARLRAVRGVLAAAGFEGEP
jgi:hypothetical protein